MIPKWLPGALQDFAQWMRPRALKVIDWKPLLKDSTRLATQWLSKRTYRDLCAQINEHSPDNVHVTPALSSPPGQPLIEVSSSEQLKAGHLLLTLYFAQFKCEAGFFLDLSYDSFQWDKNSQTLFWTPTALWTTLDTVFREAVWELYSAYYNDDDERFVHSLYQLGMLPTDANSSAKDDTIRTLYEHFGTGKQEAVPFSREKFKESFGALFDLFERQRIQLPADFSYLGVYLYSLYNTLDHLGGAYNVRASFLQATQPE